MAKFPLDTTLPKNIPLLIRQRAKEDADVNLQASKNKKGEFDFYTYKQVYDIVIQLALALRKIGVKRGSNVALISDNRKEWLWTDLAVLSLGAADVPRGCDSMGNEIRFIINFADCEIGFFENARQLEKVLENVKEVPNLKQAYIFDDVDDDMMKKFKASKIKVGQFEDLLKEGQIVALDIDGQKRMAVVKELQFHPVKETLFHIDFLEVTDKKPVTVEIPVTLQGHAAGVKAGGKLRLNMRKLKVNGLYTQLPDRVEIDVTELGLGKKINVQDVKLAEGLKLMNAPTLCVAEVKATRQSAQAAAE